MVDSSPGATEDGALIARAPRAEVFIFGGESNPAPLSVTRRRKCLPQDTGSSTQRSSRANVNDAVMAMLHYPRRAPSLLARQDSAVKMSPGGFEHFHLHQRVQTRFSRPATPERAPGRPGRSIDLRRTPSRPTSACRTSPTRGARTARQWARWHAPTRSTVSGGSLLRRSQ